MLINSSKSGHPCLVPDLRGNPFSFSLLRIIFTVGLPYVAFIMLMQGFPGGTSFYLTTANAGDTRDLGLISESGRSPGEGNGNPLQYSCLENSISRAWLATVHGIT